MIRGAGLKILCLSLLKTRLSQRSCVVRSDRLFGRHGQMAWDPSSDIPLRGSHAPRVGAGESRAEAATRRVESASATAAADGDGPDLLDRVSETLEELAEFLAGGEEPRPGSHRVGFLHGTYRDLSSPVRAHCADPQPASASAFQCHGASDCRMDGAPTARGVRAGGGAPVSDSGPRPSLWRTIFASGPDVGHPGGRHCAPLAVAKRVCRAGDWLDSTGMP